MLILALHTPVFKPKSDVLLFSPGQRQSQEIFRKVLDAYNAIGDLAPAVAERHPMRNPNSRQIVDFYRYRNGTNSPGFSARRVACRVGDEPHFTHKCTSWCSGSAYQAAS